MIRYSLVVEKHKANYPGITAALKLVPLAVQDRRFLGLLKLCSAGPNYSRFAHKCLNRGQNGDTDILLKNRLSL